MSAEGEFKTLVRELHKAGIECIPEMYFTGKELPGEILSVLRYWVEEYHVDGFHLTGFPDLSLAAEDPFLKRTKLFAENWNDVMNRLPETGLCDSGRWRGICGGKESRGIQYAVHGGHAPVPGRAMRGCYRHLSFGTRRNPMEYAVINYMANTNGFTLMDTVSYDRKHNEKRRARRTGTGSDYNYSWNCGAEGPTRKEKKSWSWKETALKEVRICSCF